MAHPIESNSTAMGKDERALSVSGYVYRESVKYTDYAFDKTTVHKRKSRNHLVDQIESFRTATRTTNEKTICWTRSAMESLLLLATEVAFRGRVRLPPIEPCGFF